MVGTWMLGLGVQHAYDTAFCCTDSESCGKTEAEVKAEAAAKVRSCTRMLKWHAACCVRGAA